MPDHLGHKQVIRNLTEKQNVYPGSRIQKQQQKRGVKKKFVVILFFVASNFTKMKIIYFWTAKENNLCQFLKNYTIFYPKNCQKALKNKGMGSGIWKKPIPDPGFRGQKGTGSRIRIRNTAEKYCRLSSPGPQFRSPAPAHSLRCESHPSHPPSSGRDLPYDWHCYRMPKLISPA